MKYHVFIGFLLALTFLVACHNKVPKVVELAETPSPELAAIDSLMWQRPDSALAVLQAFAASPAADSLDVFDGHYCQLLVSELLYKNDYGQSNRNALLQAVAYFDSLTFTLNDKPSHRHLIADADPLSLTRNDNLVFLDARAHYINGVGYYERDSVVEACGEYLKALKTMEEHFEEKKLVGYKAKFMALTYNRLGDMFSEQFMMDPAIYCYKNSYRFAIISPISAYSIANALYRIGKQFNKKEVMDSASYYYAQAIANISDTISVYYRDIVSSQAFLSYQLTHQAETSIQRLKQMVHLTEDHDEKLTRYLTIGHLYFEDRQYDSAQLYMKSVFEHTNDALSQMQAAEYLRILCDSLDSKKESDYYMRFLALHKPMEYDADIKISSLNKLFENHLVEKQKQLSEQEKHEERRQAVKKTIRVLAPLTLCIVAIIILLARHRHKKNILQYKQELDAKEQEAQQKMKETERKYKADLAQQEEEAKKALEEAKTEHEQSLLQQQAEAQILLEEKNKQIERERKARQREKEKLQQDLLQRKEQVNTLEKALTQQQDKAEHRREAFMKEAICIKINDSIRNLHITAREGTKKNVTLNEADNIALREAVLRHYANFDTTLLSKNPKMGKDDLQLCQLYLLGLDERQIAALQCKTYSAIKKRANTLKAAMGLSETLSAYILKFSSLEEP